MHTHTQTNTLQCADINCLQSDLAARINTHIYTYVYDTYEHTLRSSTYVCVLDMRFIKIITFNCIKSALWSH